MGIIADVRQNDDSWTRAQDPKKSNIFENETIEQVLTTSNNAS